MRAIIEVHDVKQLTVREVAELKKMTFSGWDGWMKQSIMQIRKGEPISPEYPSRQFDLGYKLCYDRGNALIAKTESGEVMGWALVRHPNRRNVVYPYGNKIYKASIAGYGPDFMTYIKPAYRKEGVAKQLLTVAYSNYGKLRCFPHDVPSVRFYKKHRQFVIRSYTGTMSTAAYEALEVF